jgi:UDP-2,3-diacylglucosamine pyrophosphatase LpxH
MVKVRRSVLVFLNVFIALLMMLSMSACAAKQNFKFDSDTALRTLLLKAPDFPQTSFIVMSDIHIYDTSLGTTGSAFEDYLLNDRKMLRESQEILDAAITTEINLKPNIILISGDLTKDGEKSSHEIVAQKLKRLKDAGKRVYVIPGNHDINNPMAFKYEGSQTTPVENITAGDFARIYADFGFGEALFRDTDSLSYVAEPQAGMWLLCLDSCRYRENVAGTEPIVDGKFSAATLQWIEEMLNKAATGGKAVIVMMHHGVMEHYVGQEKNYGDYIIDNYEEIGRMFAAYNARVVFTGHYHALDITVKQYPNEKFLYDVETGSLVTSPLPYRVVTIGSNQQMTIRTEKITSIPSHPQDLPEYAHNYVLEGIASIATRTLMKYGVDKAEAAKLAEQVAEAFAAHYEGDENLTTGKEPIQLWGLSLPGWFVIQFRKDLVYGLWQDLPPADNNITIDLKTGSWK